MGRSEKISRDLADSWHDGNDAEKELDKIIVWDFNWYRTVGANNHLLPPFEFKVIEELPDGTQRIQNGDGLIERIKPGVNSIPAEDDYQLKDRESFESLYKPRMQFAHERIDLEFFKNFNDTRDNDVPIGLHLGSVLGNIRKHLIACDI